MGKPNFREENRGKIEKTTDFLDIWGAIFPVCLWNIQTPPPFFSFFLSQNTSSSLEIGRKTSMFLNKFPSIPLTLHHSLPEVLG